MQDHQTVEARLKVEEKKRVLPIRNTSGQWVVVSVWWNVVPGYDLQFMKDSMSDAGFKREILGDWSQSTGKAVYPEFNRDLHVSLEPLAFDVHKPIYIGLDFGGCPAAVFTQINTFGQWLIFPPIAPSDENSLGVYELGEMIQTYITQKVCIEHNREMSKLKLVFFGDPAGAAPPAKTAGGPKETRSCFDILRKGIDIYRSVDADGNEKIVKKPGFGWRIIPGKVDISARLESVRARLTTLVNKYPALVVDVGAQSIIEGFQGAYHYKERMDGRHDYHPYKDWYSHQMDALAYIATRLFGEAQKEDSSWDDEDYTRTEFRSHAAARNER